MANETEELTRSQICDKITQCKWFNVFLLVIYCARDISLGILVD